MIIQSSDLPADVAANPMVETWIAGVNARALRVAPCLTADPTDDQLAEAKLVLIGAIMRWSQAGAGALQSQGAGPYTSTFDTRQRTGHNLWPSEITQLQDICKVSGPCAFAVDTVPVSTACVAHPFVCDT
ncbi:hypothetical protein [Gordonia sp. (in: high G+C Gram-positive bacteria)]|uniref:hypothetical protein n=1 Tax=Gordonia sp. (in: high G+C Gram-positive bacteria) TaxID=84139 RepID=UPI002636F2B4|nr:hypothetical protein [Gordonia sp. (in: high G+C Gram-positive bacteria)]